MWNATDCRCLLVREAGVAAGFAEGFERFLHFFLRSGLRPLGPGLAQFLQRGFERPL